MLASRPPRTSANLRAYDTAFTPARVLPVREILDQPPAGRARGIGADRLITTAEPQSRFAVSTSMRLAAKTLLTFAT